MIEHFIHRYLYRLAISLACLLLASCAALKPQVVEEDRAAKEPADWSLQQQARQQISSWEVRGRLGVQTAKDGGALDIIWKQSLDDFSIRLLAPLGSGTYLIQGDQKFVEIRYPDGSREILNNIDDIFNAALHVDLPATAIRDWIRGLPASELSIEQISWDEQGLLHRLKQSGWNVEMTRYTGEKILFPHAIYLSRDDNQELDIRLILRQWLVDTESDE